MKIIVSGGAGFIGSNLVDRLISEGHYVVILDDFSSGNEKFVNKKARVARCDIRDAEKVSGTFFEYRPEAVFHLAAQIDLRESIKNPKKFREVNVEGSQNLIDASVRCQVKKFVFSSSAAVYGNNQNFPIKETEPIAPISPYGEQKAETEYEIKNSGVPSTVLRYSNVYGPCQGTVGEGGVVAVFCKRLLDGDPIVVFGSGDQTRDFVFVSDIVNANVRALSSESDFAVYNASTAKQTSVNELAGALLKISGKTGNIKYSDPKAGEVQRSALDSRLIQKELDWAASVGLYEGLKKTWQWFLNRK